MNRSWLRWAAGRRKYALAGYARGCPGRRHVPLTGFLEKTADPLRATTTLNDLETLPSTCEDSEKEPPTEDRRIKADPVLRRPPEAITRAAADPRHSERDRIMTRTRSVRLMHRTPGRNAEEGYHGASRRRRLWRCHLYLASRKFIQLTETYIHALTAARSPMTGRAICA